MHDALAAEIDAERFPPRESDGLERALFEVLGDVRGKRVLDLGCGHGGITLALIDRGALVTGIDISSGMVDVARRRVQAFRPEAKAQFVVGDAMIRTSRRERSMRSSANGCCITSMSTRRRERSGACWLRADARCSSRTRAPIPFSVLPAIEWQVGDTALRVAGRASPDRARLRSAARALFACRRRVSRLLLLPAVRSPGDAAEVGSCLKRMPVPR